MPEPADPVIEVEQLSYAYADGIRALDDIRIRVHANESIGLVGPNGAGKTTFFLCLAGVLPSALGAIRVCGLDPAKPSERKQLPSHLGIVFQNSDDQLFNTTVADDVAFGPLNQNLHADEVRARVRESLVRVGLADLEHRSPFHLSSGEKRRAAIAGVLAMNPEILLLDEPSMFLDPRGRRELIALLRSIARTMIVASHDLELIRAMCSRVLVLDGGKLVADGSTDSILSNGELLEMHGLK